jgi:hypothetical protein
MKPVEWKTYRTRFLVRAKKLNYALSFTDHLGRQHCGRKGDYLVESSEGVLSIAPRQIFEDIYVPMPQRRKRTPDFARHDNLPVLQTADLRFAPLVEELKLDDFELEDLKMEALPYPMGEPRRAEHDPPSRARRKSPQPVHTSTSRLGLM